MNGHELTQKNDLYICAGKKIDQSNILIKPRIGISRAQDVLWRFYIKNNPFVSKK